MYLDYYREFIDGTQGLQKSISQSVLKGEGWQTPLAKGQEVQGRVMTPIRPKYLNELTKIASDILVRSPKYLDIETHTFFPNTAGYGRDFLLDENVLFDKKYPVARFDLSATCHGVETGFSGDIDLDLRMSLMDWATWVQGNNKVPLYQRLIEDRYEWRHCQSRKGGGPTFMQMLTDNRVEDFNCAPIAFRSETR